MITVRRMPILAAAAIGAILVAAGCSSSTTSTTPPTATTSSAPATQPSSSAPPTSAAADTSLKVGLPKFPTALSDSAGKAIYLFTADTGNSSTCSGACASAWPPVLTTGAPSITGGDKGKLGTTTRADGTKQLTYNGHPLYYFVGDSKAGDTNGEGSKAFGAEWYLIGSNGSKIDNS